MFRWISVKNMGRNRLSGVTATGLEASLIGLTMAGCIGVGYLIGNWLDGRLGTTYCTPIMVILGIIAGAREMWLTVARIRKSFSDGTFNSSGHSTGSNPPEMPQMKSNRAAIAEDDHRKPRFFHVPPPPAPGETSDNSPRSEGQEALENSLENQLSQLRKLQQQIEAADEEDSSSSPGIK